MRIDGRPSREHLNGDSAVQIEATRLNERDTEAWERDQVAIERDSDALARDTEADARDVKEELRDKHTLRVQELRSRAAAGRRRAAADRERGRRGRKQAARDRLLAAQDREQAGTDELTGARRRGVGLEEFDREIDRARRTDGTLSAVFVDVDGLKSVNDALGHGAGDELLCEVVEGLQRHMRSYDLVVRLGGDEFLCVLPDVAPEDARAHFKSLNAELQGGAAKGSVSVGISELHEGDRAEELMERADRDLLAARAEQRGPVSLRPPG